MGRWRDRRHGYLRAGGSGGHDLRRALRPGEEPDGEGTRVTQEFETVGRISAISSWVFSRGSYEGSFRGELEKFGRIAEREAQQ